MQLRYARFPQAGPPSSTQQAGRPKLTISVPRIRIGLQGPRSSVTTAQVRGAERADQAVGGAQILQKERAGFLGGQAGPCGTGSSSWENFLIELKAATCRIQGKIRLNQGFRSDLMWWATFLEMWNGVSMMREHRPLQATTQIWTDASGRFGCGSSRIGLQEYALPLGTASTSVR